MIASSSTLERRPDRTVGTAPAPRTRSASSGRPPEAPATVDQGPRIRILRELRRRPGQVCRDAVLRHAGWGALRPALGEYPRLMSELARAVAEDGEGTLERVCETGWILQPSA